MNRILLYVHFNVANKLSDHVVYQLKSIRPLFDKVVFITNSELSLNDSNRMEDLCDTLIQRDNVGYDFSAWRDGMKSIGWDELAKYDSLTLMNDTCFGPIHSLKKVYTKMEQSGVDFWGITDHSTLENGMPGSNDPIPYHIQSYMATFNTNVVISKVFRLFWENVKDHKSIVKVIQDYETQLTAVLLNAGFSCGVFFNTEQYSTKNGVVDTYNYSELKPAVMLENSVPLLKIKSFLHTRHKTIFKIVEKTDYPVDIIREHLKSMHIVNNNTLKIQIKHKILKYVSHVPGYKLARHFIRKRLKA